ncbi:MAG TPA: ROK family transcriptional regulator [Candidatus Limnocylindria bacterium]|nr:ROK family transcriptional regulator [Candidatus Limnocylindria bacterium]
MGVSRETSGQRSETVRRANLSTIVRELHLRGPLSRSDLVSRTGLTRGAIRGLIGELVGDGLVREERSAPIGTPGRPSPLVRPRQRRATVLALDIAVDSIGAALVGFGGLVVDETRVDRARGHLAAERIAADLARIALPLVKRHGARDSLIGIGVAMVGVVRLSDGLVRLAPNLGWQDVPLGDMLSRRLQLGLPVTVANEADLGALAEHRRGVAAGIDDVLYLSGEVGVGGGVLVDGQPLVGAAGYAGEVGHMPVNPQGAICRCGSIGCWETEVGERALLRRAGRHESGGRAAVDAVIAGAEAGSPAELAALSETGRWLGIGLAGLVNLFNPALVVLGGVFGRMAPFVADEVEEALDRRALRAARETVNVVPTSLGADTTLIGAAETAFEPFLGDPAAWLSPRARPLRLASA